MKNLISILFVAILLSATAIAENSFELEISFNRSECTFILRADESTISKRFAFDEVGINDNRAFVGNDLLFDEQELIVGSNAILFSELRLEEVYMRGNTYTAVFERKSKTGSHRRRRRGDRITAFTRVEVGEREFIRGDLVSFGGGIVIDGEVNGNVIALFADIRLNGSAICQRDVYAIGGRIKRHHDSHIYGNFQATEKWQNDRRRRQHRYREHENAVGFGLGFDYNRVDGVLLDSKLEFQSAERILPRVFIHYGYGFESEQTKYKLGFEQALFSYHQMKFGGSLYRQTKSEDEWIVGELENSLYAIVAKEDFRDYYMGEGGDAFIEQSVGYDHILRVTYSYDKLGYLEAHPRLWSLFGGNKLFRSNFSSVAYKLRNQRLADYDLNEALLHMVYLYNTLEDDLGRESRSGWIAGIKYEHSSSALGSDFAYDRWTVEIRRHQPLTYRQNLNFRLTAGSATGELPLHRLFYLGGIRTLRAYDIKEFYGSRMALFNLEYWISFPNTSINVALLFDAGKTGWNSDFLSDGDFKGDVGIGAQLDDGLRLELTRQLNGDSDSIQFSILIGRSF